MNRRDNIEELFRKTFDGYRVAPSAGLWNHLARKLAVREFLHFSWSSLNVWYVAALVAAGVSTWLILTPVKSDNMQYLRHSSGQNTIVTDTLRETPPGGSAGETTAGQRVRDQENETQKQKIAVEAVPAGKQERQQPATGSPEIPAESATVKSGTGTTDSTGQTVAEKKSTPPVTHRVAPRPEAAFSLDVRNGCPPLSVKFHNHSKEYYSLQWHFGNGASSAETDPEYIFDDPGTYVISLDVLGTDDLLRTAHDTVTVYQPPVARFETMVPETGAEELPVSFYNYSVDAVRWLWNFGDHTRSAASDPIHHYTGDGPYNVKLKVWSAEGCADSMVLNNAFEKNPYYIRFPDAFVPNPNGPCGGYYTRGMNINEVFHPVYFGVSDYRLRIYNRFGELLFESTDIRRGWDGYFNGTLAKQDVYIWKARGTFANGKPFMKYGNVTLVKK